MRDFAMRDFAFLSATISIRLVNKKLPKKSLANVMKLVI